MQVAVRFFASLRDDLGASELSLALGADVSVAGLLSQLAQQFGDAASALREDGVRIAVNQQLVAQEGLLQHQLKPGDEIAFLPPVTGG